MNKRFEGEGIMVRSKACGLLGREEESVLFLREPDILCVTEFPVWGADHAYKSVGHQSGFRLYLGMSLS